MFVRSFVRSSKRATSAGTEVSSDKDGCFWCDVKTSELFVFFFRRKEGRKNEWMNEFHDFRNIPTTRRIFGSTKGCSMFFGLDEVDDAAFDVDGIFRSIGIVAVAIVVDPEIFSTSFIPWGPGDAGVTPWPGPLVKDGFQGIKSFVPALGTTDEVGPRMHSCGLADGKVPCIEPPLAGPTFKEALIDSVRKFRIPDPKGIAIVGARRRRRCMPGSLRRRRVLVVATSPCRRGSMWCRWWPWR